MLSLPETRWPGNTQALIVLLKRIAYNPLWIVAWQDRPTVGQGAPTVSFIGFSIVGDHRDNSSDSRRLGPIGRDLNTGKAVRILPGGGR